MKEKTREKMKEIGEVFKVIFGEIYKNKKVLLGVFMTFIYTDAIVKAMDKLTEQTYIFVLTIFFVWSIIKIYTGIIRPM